MRKINGRTKREAGSSQRKEVNQSEREEKERSWIEIENDGLDRSAGWIGGGRNHNTWKERDKGKGWL